MFMSNQPKQLKQFKKNGFTLIEIMIVMSIVALLMGLVGPLAIQNLEKAEAKSELMSVNNWLKQVSYRAYIGGQELTLKLNGKEVQLFTTKNSKLIKQESFEYLFFQPQQLVFNNKGFVSPTKIIGSYRGKPLELDLKKWINHEEATL